jgi:hypothetical protein
MIFIRRLLGAEMIRAPRAAPAIIRNSTGCTMTIIGPPSRTNPPKTDTSTITEPIITNMSFIPPVAKGFYRYAFSVFLKQGRTNRNPAFQLLNCVIGLREEIIRS